MRYDWGKRFGGRERVNNEDCYLYPWDFERIGRHSLTLQPLELFKYVIDNDKNYKEITTADYTMVNNVLHKVYRSNVSGLPPYN